MSRYRTADERDLPAICALGEALAVLHHDARPDVFAPASAIERDRDHWARAIGHDDAQTFVAVEHDAVVGFVTVFVAVESSAMLQPLRFARIGSVCVAPSRRGVGIGSGLMAEAETWAARQRATEIRLMVWTFNRAAVDLYEELGYAASALSMAKALPPS